MKIEDFEKSMELSIKAEAENQKFVPKKVLPWAGDGWYMGMVKAVKNYGDALMLDFEIYDLHDAERYFGPRKGWLRPYTTGDDPTSWFFDAFGNPRDPKDTIGLACAVYVQREFSASHKRHFENVVKFAELPAEKREEELKNKKAK